MVRTWNEGRGNDFACPHCHALYSVMTERLPARDRDTADCEVCGMKMSEWNGTEIRVFRLKAN
ncbi:MJ0042-type zinc finger domain-containing protein [Cypionkella sp.]|uniref:MJ0042-type zinc finger domain-containing protein n=1 Tax=Cypionkella sp. TaxID=2811411 RepID=UPI00351D0280